MTETWEVMMKDEGPKEVILEIRGVKIPIKVRDLSWTEKIKFLVNRSPINQMGQSHLTLIST